MGDGDASLEVQISTPGTEESSADVAALREELAKLKVEIAGLREAHTKAGESAHEHGHQARELHHAMRELNQLAPGLGLALRAAMRPANLGFAAAVLGLKELVEVVKEYKKHLKEIAEEQAKIDVAVWTKSIEAMSKAKDMAVEYAKAVTAIITPSKNLNEVEDEAKRILDAKEAARKKVLGGTEGQKTELDRHAKEEHVALLKQNLAGEEQALKRAKAAFQDAEDNRETGVPASVIDAAARAEGGKEKLEKEKNKAQLNLNRAKALPDEPELRGPYGVPLGISGSGIKAAQVAQAEQKLKEAQEAQAEATEAIRRHAAALKKLDDAYKTAEDEFKALSETVRKNTNEIRIGGELDKIDLGGEAAVRAGKNKTFIPDSAAGLTFAEAVHGETGVGFGVPMTPDMREAVQHVTQALKSTGKTNAQILEILKLLQNQNTDFESKMNILFSSFKALKGQVSGRNLNAPP